MTLSLYVNERVNIVDLVLLTNYNLLPSPQAVGYGFIIFSTTDNFGFYEPFKGFGDKNDPSLGGTFARKESDIIDDSFKAYKRYIGGRLWHGITLNRF